MDFAMALASFAALAVQLTVAAPRPFVLWERAKRVEESPEAQNDAQEKEDLPPLGGFFDSLADSLAQNDTQHVTLSEATSEVAKSKGPHRYRGALHLLQRQLLIN